MKETKAKPPIRSYKLGNISLNLWESTDGFFYYTFQKSYKDDKDEWQHTTSLKMSDILRLRELLDSAVKENIAIE